MKATKIKMFDGKRNSNNLLEIESIYLEGAIDKPGYYRKEIIHDFIYKNPSSIKVNIYPYPKLIPMTSTRGQKYVKSVSNGIVEDNLLALPRE
ncbi:DUF3892 domain-containing protein [Listeria newyorkensis]|uniref:DUF3892 domain-containing protein n=1 Tax=Listeria newyorkensis TaxID=1497681 RepID=A0A841YZ82_9LIST|nr:DUF3892 domain-containing protein [Listeria newyorkensis]MBC1458399.1 DUF3892 domain-containing protein [Listeria newyorkensis]